jgi:hypothetical protein
MSIRYSLLLVPDVPPNLIVTTVCLDILLIPCLRRTNTTLREVAGLGGLAVGLDGSALVQRDLAVVACAAGRRAVCDFSARELALYVCAVDTGFPG